MNQTAPLHRRFVASALLLAAVALASCNSAQLSSEMAMLAAQKSAENTVVTIICERDGTTQLRGSEVLATRKGVRVRVWNVAGEPISINGLGLDFEPGVHERIANTPPGEVAVACWPYSRHEDVEPPPQPLRIVDPQGIWVSPELECAPEKMESLGQVDHVYDGRGEPGTPEQVVRHLQLLLKLLGTDVIERAGYPEAANPSIRVVREDRTFAVVGLSPANKGGWFVDTIAQCAS